MSEEREKKIDTGQKQINKTDHHKDGKGPTILEIQIFVNFFDGPVLKNCRGSGNFGFPIVVGSRVGSRMGTPR